MTAKELSQEFMTRIKLMAADPLANWIEFQLWMEKRIEEFRKEHVLGEREACAKIVESSVLCAATIRNRPV